MIRIMRPRSKIQLNYVLECIHLANTWCRLTSHKDELMAAVIIDKNNMLIEYDILARGTPEYVIFDHMELINRSISLGAKDVTLLHNHSFVFDGILSNDDIIALQNVNKEARKFNLRINYMVCMGGISGQIYDIKNGISVYDNKKLETINEFFEANGLPRKKLKKECIILADALSTNKYNTKAKMKRAMARVTAVAEETKNYPTMYTRTRLDQLFNREQKIYYAKPLPEPKLKEKMVTKPATKETGKPCRIIQLT